MATDQHPDRGTQPLGGRVVGTRALTELELGEGEVLERHATSRGVPREVAEHLIDEVRVGCRHRGFLGFVEIREQGDVAVADRGAVGERDVDVVALEALDVIVGGNAGRMEAEGYERSPHRGIVQWIVVGGVRIESNVQGQVRVWTELFEDPVWLGAVRSACAQQQRWFVLEHCLEFGIAEGRPIEGSDEGVTSPVQAHLAIHLQSKHISRFWSP